MKTELCELALKEKTARTNKISAARVLGVAVLLLAAGCATHPKTAKKFNFFPPPPDEPRLQFLTAFASEHDLRGNGGSLLSYVTGEKPPENPFGKPYGAAVSGKKIYVCDTSLGVVLVLDLQARRLRGISPRGEGSFRLPLNMAIDAEGNYYVADSGREQVIILDAGEHFVAALGEKGAMQPRDVAVGKDRFYVADIKNHCVHVYDKAQRTVLFDVPNAQDASDLKRKLFQPTNLAVDSEGRIYVSDSGAYRIQVYDPSGKFLRTVGRYGDNVGEFTRVKGVAVDRENRLYAVDAASQVVQIFDDQGKLLMWFGQPESSDVGLDLPSKVLVDYDDVGLFQDLAAPNFQIEHLVLVINQLGPRKVSVFGFGHKK